jgi:hypothetical protein
MVKSESGSHLMIAAALLAVTIFNIGIIFGIILNANMAFNNYQLYTLAIVELMLVLGLFWHYYRHREDPLGK